MAVAEKAPPAPALRRPWRRRVLETLAGWGELSSTPYGLAPVVMLGAVSFIATLDSGSFGIAEPRFVRLGINIGQIIVVSALVGLVAIFGNLLIGYWAERHPRVPLFSAGIAISGIGCAFTGFGRSTLSLGVARTVDGAVGGDVTNVPVFPLLSDYYPTAFRVRAFSLLGALGDAGTLVALPLGAGLITAFGLKSFFAGVGVALVAAGAACLIKLKEPPRGGMERREMGLSEQDIAVEDEPISFGESWRAVWSIRTVRRLFVGDLIGALASPTAVFLPLLLTDHYHLTTIELAVVGVPAVVAAIVTRLVSARVLDRLLAGTAERAFFIYGLFAATGALSLVAVGAELPLAALVVVQVLVVIGGALIGPAINALYSQVIPARVRTLGLQMTGLSAVPAQLFAFPVFGLLFYKYGYATVFYAGAPFLLLAAAVYATAGGFFESDRRNALVSAAASRAWEQARAKGSAKLLSVHRVDVAYGEVQVLFGVDFEIEAGEVVALLGTNGAGKSSLLRAISGTQEASGGAIVFEGRDITHMPPHEIARRGVVQMPGGRGIFADVSVRDNLALGAWTSAGQDGNERELQRVLALFPALRPRLDAPAGVLSGGEQQMLALAQAMLMRPKLLLIDELSLGLAPAVVGELLEVVRRIAASGVAVVVVEQSVNVALEVADRAVFLEKGEVRFRGSTAELMNRPDVLRAIYVKGTSGLRSPVRSRAEGAAAALSVRGVSKSYGGVVALSGVSLELRRGEVLGLIGPNGSGKTTLLDVVSGFQAPDAGSVLLDGEDITGLSPEARAERGLVRRFQDAGLFPSLSVYETLLVSLERQVRVRSAVAAGLALRPARRDERRARARADELVELLSLGEHRDKLVGALSTGLRRITDLACVLGADPEVLLLDEPSSGIAQAEAEGLAPLLRRVRAETGCGMLIVEHDIPLVTAVSDELLAFHLGQLIVRGSASRVLEDEAVISSYLGSSKAAIRRSGELEEGTVR